ncbi:MAG: hypothetical protein AB7K04_04475 [Pseudorhodoplanes sp.]
MSHADPTIERRRGMWPVLAAAFALAVFASSHAFAGDDDDEDITIEQKVFRSLFGLNRPDIDYRERSPLVIPPSRDLPPPEKTAINSPAWPVDADVKRKREERKRDRDGRTRMDPEAEARPLSPAELERGRVAPRARGGSTGPATERDVQERLLPSQLGYTGGLWSKLFKGDSAETAKFNGEPPRSSLIEPPVGYRTPSPGQPYGLSKDNYTPKALNPMDKPAQ